MRKSMIWMLKLPFARGLHCFFLYSRDSFFGRAHFHLQLLTPAKSFWKVTGCWCRIHNCGKTSPGTLNTYTRSFLIWFTFKSFLHQIQTIVSPENGCENKCDCENQTVINQQHLNGYCFCFVVVIFILSLESNVFFVGSIALYRVVPSSAMKSQPSSSALRSLCVSDSIFALEAMATFHGELMWIELLLCLRLKDISCHNKKLELNIWLTVRGDLGVQNEVLQLLPMLLSQWQDPTPFFMVKQRKSGFQSLQ